MQTSKLQEKKGVKGEKLGGVLFFFLAGNRERRHQSLTNQVERSVSAADDNFYLGVIQGVIWHPLHAAAARYVSVRSAVVFFGKT